ncbi:hypothetical protein AU255_05815 [Methyloprofundus sedimenti]|uniref:Beta-lactamase class A catalytic domain-containing protein n=1 Tax=Methyloprofundus sedimenti TaxID=1420851 RepID=A0A1V8M778_9GAMM|nr:hypothetical protein AU255_05815 [Methyloprofundus sedimenti]
MSCSVFPRQIYDSPKSWQAFDQKFMTLAEKSSFLASEIIEQDCTTIHAIDAEQSLAVGSSFKLYILAELAHQIATQNILVENASSDGETYLSWDTLLAIQPAYKSIPGGALLFVPDNTQFTVRYYAEQMIQRSDNTATDHLLYLLGRENIEQRMQLTGHHNPALNIPLLATREFVALKFLYSDAELADYLGKSTANKRLVLDHEQRGYQELEHYFAQNGEQSAPLRINTIEWFANRFDMCHVLMSLYNTAKTKNMRPVTEIMSLDDKLDIDREEWIYVGFKGGSEFGVLAGNWLLQRKDGRMFVISFALNNEHAAIDMQSVLPVFKSAVELLSQTP